jgi:transcriptional regulator with XRE-family HTH domain
MRDSWDPRDARLLRRATGCAIRGLRRRRGWTQEDLGGWAEIDRSYVGALECGDHMPRLDMLVRLAEALEVGVTYLVLEIERNYQMLKRKP